MLLMHDALYSNQNLCLKQYPPLLAFSICLFFAWLPPLSPSLPLPLFPPLTLSLDGTGVRIIPTSCGGSLQKTGHGDSFTLPKWEGDGQSHDAHTEMTPALGDKITAGVCTDWQSRLCRTHICGVVAEDIVSMKYWASVGREIILMGVELRPAANRK